VRLNIATEVVYYCQAYPQGFAFVVEIYTSVWKTSHISVFTIHVLYLGGIFQKYYLNSRIIIEIGTCLSLFPREIRHLYTAIDYLLCLLLAKYVFVQACFVCC